MDAGVKKDRHKGIVEVHPHVHLGRPEAYEHALRAAGFTGRIQTAFIERLNLTIRRSIAGLARRSWSAGPSLGDLARQFQWWRAYTHFARPHASLRLPLNPSATGCATQRHYTCPNCGAGAGRPRTPAQAAELTGHRWSVREVLVCPAPSVGAGQAESNHNSYPRHQRLTTSEP